jgi:phosphomannomutase
LLKEDEAPIRERAERLLQAGSDAGVADVPAPDPAIAAEYVSRFTRFFPSDALKGLRLGVYLHSAAGRDLLLATLQALGADCVPFGASEAFIPVDTEALTPGFLETARAMLGDERLDAIVSTDGDGDRPLLIDETGMQINGDVLGTLAAKALGIATVVTPLTSTSAIEQAGWFSHVVRTKVGSPFVIAAMNALGTTSGGVAGFEANGGFLLGSAVGTLKALPTRDALLPLLSVLAEANSSGEPVSQLRGRLPPRFMLAGRLEHIAQERSADFIGAMKASAEARSAFAPMLAEPQSTDTLDGYRLQLRDGTVVHFRPSGNAPELRVYVETDDAGTTEHLLADLLVRLNTHLSPADRS